MKTKVLITMLLLLVCAAIFASEDSIAPAEHWEKVRQMEQLAERFKAETGFIGEVMHSTTTMRLHVYRGNFPGVSFTADGDTIAFRQACEGIISKVLPNSQANSNQLSMSRIFKSGRGYTTDYYQQVGGYRVEGAGYIMITFDDGRKYFSISDNTVDLPEVDVSVIITREEAIRIANDEYFKNASPSVKPGKVTIAFTNGKDYSNKDYYLCYNLYMGTVVCVDAVTGDIRYTWSRVKVHSSSALVKGDVYDKEYTNLHPSPLGYQPISGVVVYTDSFLGSTDQNGIVTITDSTLVGLTVILEECPHFSVSVYPDSTMAKTADQLLLGATPIEILFDDDACHTPNVYYHANHQRVKLESLLNGSTDTLFGLVIVSGDSSLSSGGYFDPGYNKIHLSNSAGKLSHAGRPEVSHSYSDEALVDYFNIHSIPGGSLDYWAMDEAIAVYLPCAVIDRPECIYGDSLEIASLLADSNHTSNISTMFYGSALVDESFYSKSYCRYPLASAWWSLRGNQYFPADGQKNGVDTLLVHSLNQVKDELPVNNTYRYNPRYFYNILMRRVDEDSSHWPLKKTQLAIDEAYSTRGFHFTPRVISAGSNNPNKEKNKFRIGDPVHVKITNCPQNTPLTVYIVEDQDYTDGMNISSLSILYSRSLSAVDIGDDGSWTGELCNSDSLGGGEYDILVDIGNNGVLHFAYSGANIRDGFDGLTGHGFTVYDDRIEVVTRYLPSISHR